MKILMAFMLAVPIPRTYTFPIKQSLFYEIYLKYCSICPLVTCTWMVCNGSDKYWV